MVDQTKLSFCEDNHNYDGTHLYVQPAHLLIDELFMQDKIENQK